MYQQQLAAQKWWDMQQLGFIGFGGLLSSQRLPMYGDQPYLVPPQLQTQLQRGLGRTNWKDLINQAIDIANGEHQDAQIEIMRLSSENEKLKAIVEKPDWFKLFGEWQEKKDMKNETGNITL